jgi:hypothetical protein
LDVSIIGAKSGPIQERFYIDRKVNGFKLNASGPFRIVVDPDKKLLFKEMN